VPVRLWKPYITYPIINFYFLNVVLITQQVTRYTLTTSALGGGNLKKNNFTGENSNEREN